MTIGKYVVFLIIASLLLAGGHYYLWHRLARRTRLTRRWRRVVAILLVLAAFLTPFGMLLPRIHETGTATWLVGTSLGWLGVLFYLVTILAVFDVLRFVSALIGRVRRGRPDGVELQRRAFMARSVGGAAVLASGGIVGVGVTSALGPIETPHVPVRLERLPAALDNFKIALLTDLHIGPFLRHDFTKRVVAYVESLRPDLVVITGDLVDATVATAARDVAPLGDIKSRYGTYFVTGNHEYYVGAEPWLEALRAMGIQPLMNERVAIGDQGPKGASFDLIGVPDYHAERFEENHAPSVEKAVEGRDPDRELVMLAHQPVHIYDAAPHGVGLQLSGHTHGGQIWPFGFMTRLAQPYLSGLHLHDESAQIYVSNGAGFWGPPMRVLAPPQIPLIVLTT